MKAQESGYLSEWGNRGQIGRVILLIVAVLEGEYVERNDAFDASAVDHDDRLMTSRIGRFVKLLDINNFASLHTDSVSIEIKVYDSNEGKRRVVFNQFSSIFI
jgi:hypothetical protein